MSTRTVIGLFTDNAHAVKAIEDLVAAGLHRDALDLLTADGEIRTIGPGGPDDALFWATVGGIGLTGVVLRARLRLQRTESAWFVVDTDRTAGHQTLDTVTIDELWIRSVP
jgi:decaprenylphospho-beta-D-ribofuranose 2-oxidase